MKYAMLPLQVLLLVLWFTYLPSLPWWVVFLPLLLAGVGLVFFFLVLGMAALAGIGTRFK